MNVTKTSCFITFLALFAGCVSLADAQDGTYKVTESWRLSVNNPEVSGNPAMFTRTGVESGTVTISGGNYELINKTGVSDVGSLDASMQYDPTQSFPYAVDAQPVLYGFAAKGSEFYVVMKLSFFVVLVPLESNWGFSLFQEDDDYSAAGASLSTLEGSATAVDGNNAEYDAYSLSRLTSTATGVSHQLTIASPAANFKVYDGNPVIDLTGLASDSGGVADVFCVVNGDTNDPIEIDQVDSLPADSVSWTAEVDLSQYGQVGSNVITVVAQDVSGIQESVSRTFLWVETNAAAVSVNPANAGTIKGLKNGQVLQVGSGYAVSATPATKAWTFSGWTDGEGRLLSTNASFEYFDEDGTLTNSSPPTLVANFAANPFILNEGVFSGLFFDTNDVEEASSGFFTLTLAPNGAFTGKTMTSGGAYSLPGTATFGADGHARFTVPTAQATLTFDLQLDMSVPPSPQITGTVSDGAWTAGLAADRAVFGSSGNKALNYEGQYTLAILGDGDQAGFPGGIGCATASSSPAGLITLLGSLADGTAMSQSVSVSKDGRWPFYAAYAAPPVGNGGAVFGWVTLSNQPASTLGGTLYWFRPSGSLPAVCQSGFTNTATLVGSAFKAAEKPLLPLTGGGLVTLGGGNLPSSIINQVTLTSNNGIVLTGAPENRDKLALTINKTSGAVTGSFANPSNPKQSIKISGVLLQNQGMAAGYFLNDNQSGAFLLENP